MSKDMSDSYEKLVSFYGKKSQLLMLAEEVGELLQAISKVERGILSTERLAEEIADVRIMLEQITYIYDVKQEARTLEFNKKNQLRNRVKNVLARGKDNV